MRRKSLDFTSDEEKIQNPKDDDGDEEEEDERDSDEALAGSVREGFTCSSSTPPLLFFRCLLPELAGI